MEKPVSPPAAEHTRVKRQRPQRRCWRVSPWSGQEVSMTSKKIRIAGDAAAAPKVRGRPFQPGNPGRPKGARNKLSYAFFTDIYEVWLAEGKKAIKDTIKSKPADFLRVVASVLPKHVEITEGMFDGISDEELAELLAAARAALAACDGPGDGDQAAGGTKPAGGVSSVH
jgi:hypothetical protein